jgi:hypothetical protein
MKGSLKYLAAGAILVTTLLDNANAIPAFARQMGVSCSACHSENGYPMLTRFGRDFKASGYTMIGSEKTIGGGQSLSDKLISIPSALNMSVVGGTTIDGGAGTTPTTVAANNFGMFLGGRISENVGTFIEIGYDGGDSTTNPGFALANFVVPITFKVGNNTYGIEPYTTDGHTATPSEFYDNEGITALSEIGARDQYGAKGLSFYVYNPNYFINYTAWSNGNASSSGVKLANYFRVAYTPQVGIWDLEIGGQYMSGDTNDAPGGYVTNTATKMKTDAYVIDFQALGKIGKMPLDLSISYGKAKYDPNSLFTTNSDKKDGTSFVVDTALGVIPKTFVATIRYTNNDHVGTSNDKVNTTKFGARYFMTENVRLEPYYAMTSGVTGGSDDTYGLNFEVAF